MRSLHSMQGPRVKVIFSFYVLIGFCNAMSYKVIEIFVDGKVIWRKNEQGASFVNDAPCLWEYVVFLSGITCGVSSVTVLPELPSH